MTMKPAILTLTLAATLAGCATTNIPGLPGQKPAVVDHRPALTSDEKSEARKTALKEGGKSCVMGVALGALSGLLTHHVNPQAAIAGCVVAGVAGGVQSYKHEVEMYRAFKTKVTVGALVDVKTRNTQVDGKPVQTFDGMTVRIDEAKLKSKSDYTEKMLDNLADTLNKQTRPTTVIISGSGWDRYYLNEALMHRVTNKQVTLQVGGRGEGKDFDKPVLVITPMPQ